jgi:hypothetical protein
MVKGSYVSCQSALALHGVLQNHAAVVVSLCRARPYRWDTPLGSFQFRHVKVGLMFGYGAVEVAPGQEALVASAEKALLDLVHLAPGADTAGYLGGLGLQNLDVLDVGGLFRQAERSGRPKLVRAAQRVAAMVGREERGPGG